MEWIFRRTALLAAAGVILATTCVQTALAQRVTALDKLGDANTKLGVHLPQGQQVNFNWTKNDGAGYQWDIQYQGTVGQGTNYCYSQGLALQVNGSGFQSNGMGWTNKDADEIEMGPYKVANVNAYRRVKVYSDVGMARWIDIFENPGTTDVNLTVTIYTNMNWSIVKTTTNSGANAFGAKDWAFITEIQPNGNNTPVLMHMVCDAKAKVRPQVRSQNNNNSITVTYTVPVKAGGTAMLCYFESQGPSTDAHLKALKSFQAFKLLKDLPPAARKLIVNFSSSTASYDTINLERSDQGDSVFQGSGEPIYGEITNESYAIDTLALGKITLKAADVIGMTCSADAGVKILLKDGQMIRGALPQDTIHLKRTGGDLEIPFDRISQWSYKITEAKPFEIPFSGPALILRTGDRICYEPSSLKLDFKTAHGTVTLSPADLQCIRLDNTGAMHRAVFLNGSSLGGMLAVGQFRPKLRLGLDAEMNRDLLAQIAFASDERTNPILSKVVLTNGDELYGDIVNDKLNILSEYGTVDIKPEGLKAVTFNAGPSGRMAAQTWDGTVIRGRLEQDLTFEMMPGPKLTLSPAVVAGILRVQNMMPAEAVKKVEQLIGRFGAESMKDRDKATEELVAMGESIIPLLQRNLNSHQFEVRQRIQDVIDKIGGKKSSATPEPTPDMNQAFTR